MAKGVLRVYLGAAPGVGKTVAMLDEGRRRRARGTDVVIGLVETHDRTFTRGAVGDLPVIPRTSVRHRGIDLDELDIDAVLARQPQVALIDEFAHTNAPGAARPKRWQDVQVLLEAGIDVISTLNVQHLESLNDVVTAITGVVQRETVPDAVVRSADAIELVDMSPSALRRRLAHGHVYPAERVDAALGNYFREGNLTALRELALLWLADRVDEGLDKYRAQHRISATWAARERIVVALPGGPEGAMLLRRGARIAGSAAGRSLVAVHVLRSDGTGGSASPADLEEQRILVEKLGGTLHLVVGDDIPAAVLAFARTVNATQIVLGASTHDGWRAALRRSSVMSIVRDSGDIDVHVVTHPAQSTGRVLASLRQWRLGLRELTPNVRSGLRWLLAIGIPWAVTAILLPLRTSVNLSTEILVFLLGVLVTALASGVVPAVVSAVLAALLANFYFTPPVGSFTIATPENVFALAVFVVIAVTVASVVTLSARRATQAASGRAEAQILATAVAGSTDDDDPVTSVLERARVAFGMGAAVLRESNGVVEMALASAGDVPATGAPDVLVSATEELRLGLWGHPLPASQHRLVEVFAQQAAQAWEQRQLSEKAAEVEHLRATDSVRTAILSALSHDLRTPLATIKAAITGLADDSVDWAAGDRAELLASAGASADQLDDLLNNLLDLSRLQTGVLTPMHRPASVDEVVSRAMLGLSGPGSGGNAVDRILDDIPDDLPLLSTDAALLERVLANIVGNALRYSPAGGPVRLQAAVVDGEDPPVAQIRVVDHGPGVPERDRGRMFAPFQRLGDAPAGIGVGLGLAVARGLAEAMGVRIDVDDTPGGGLTVIVSVPLDQAARQPAGSERPR